MQEVTAIFDLGKTNKKFFLFDHNYQEVYRSYKKFQYTHDEDGYPCDDLIAIQGWAKDLFDEIVNAKKYNVVAINFSSYGASLVHIDLDGKPLTPLYNYTKPLPAEIMESLINKYGPIENITADSASPLDGFLNSALQLYWIKEKYPQVFDKIRYSLHLPQYLSYIFTGIPVSDPTSIGCHTLMWHYKKNDYHSWIKEEGLAKKLAPIVESDVSINMNYNGKWIQVGIGIHDSSAALLPYIRGSKKSFTLISTGTWSVVLKPGGSSEISLEELSKGCLLYQSPDGETVRASRFMMGQQFDMEIKKISSLLNKEPSYYKQVKFNQELYSSVNSIPGHFFHINGREETESLKDFEDFESAYHRLVYELVLHQVEHVKLAEGNSSSDVIFIDGGFVDNEVFIEILSQHFPDRKIMTSKSAVGSALGAAIVISKQQLGKKFLKKKYGVRKHIPLILSKIEEN